MIETATLLILETPMTGGAMTMGRPKKSDPPKPKRPPDERMAIIHLKGTAAYAEWLDAAHKKTRLPKATIFRIGVELWADSVGLKRPPEL